MLPSASGGLLIADSSREVSLPSLINKQLIKMWCFAWVVGALCASVLNVVSAATAFQVAALNHSKPNDDNLRAITRRTYERLAPCFLNSHFGGNAKQPVHLWRFPLDADDHYRSLLIHTEKFRNIAIHRAAGYHGENTESATSIVQHTL